ncbi:2-oxoglutarate dehydrogenase, E2 component, dihydrolipoamide succinyltransferase [Corynebacterium ulcerans]|uniref:2-oxoglutarate dehydrogenase, E2 component, dihydrolipoamide succinyltransferase n=2 Tax=Corynebacterium ulcerans TaxID=65058 RepID=UPI00052AA37B|nr:2-oxoglutarate dehydrogenase, E2 component, dihydrolipoamide succinyltransferase [Corynebacterium ulcerans]AIU92158.1 Dihydrolipoamide acyltransferase [Corynebacterium ulcerans]KPH75021.1 pyruvate dehydrogenase [Corynebacterium ulcerans]MBL4943253.1 2-oxoglutarate dehydrogenase, E2 component, dihydrolipoamide succinyltransferase [Corynebacterium ulcerans]QGZ25877.1 2-oxoglutarate dehydrogenase, E2 component, dihydrolipoamide succinyltransferase [Corynebacterium ulcerans]QOE24567.1 2-oxoglut
MAHSVEMPELGESVTEGTITQWLKSVGDTVAVDEPLLEVSTDKVDTEVPSPVAGVLLEVRFDEDDTVDVGEVIAIIGEEGEAPAASDSAEKKEEPKAEAQAEEETTTESKEAPKGSGSSTDVVMPELGESVTEGTITQWLKSVGDTVDVDEPLLEVSTDKVDTEVPSPVAGTILEVLFNEDDTVDVGEVIVRIGEPGSEPEAKAEPAKEEPKEEAPAEEEPAKEAPKGSGSSTDVVMPELGESVTEGTITQWLKSVGDTVDVDEPLLEVSTDKVDTEVPSPVAGTILEVLFNEDDTVDVGEVIVRIGEPGSEPETKAEPAKEEPKEEAPKAEEAPAKEAAKPVNNQNVPYVTPLVRKLANKHGVDLNKIEGTGVGGRIRKQDVLAAAGQGSEPVAAAAPAAAAKDPRANWSTKSVDPAKAELIGTTKKVNRIREITAKKMVEALQISAQLTHLQEVDMTNVATLRKENKPAFIEKYGANLTYLPFFVKAVVEALVLHPNVNASYNAATKEITYHSDVNVAIAVDTERGLLTPVIHKAQELTLPEIAQAIADLADRARNNKLKPNDLSGATFTVTNIGSEGALADTPILVPPQVGILGTAAIQKRPVVITENGSDAIAIRQMCYIPFSYDHQIVDGADAGRFTATIKDRLEKAKFQDDLNL